jgi:hypothetical protein
MDIGRTSEKPRVACEFPSDRIKQNISVFTPGHSRYIYWDRGATDAVTTTHQEKIYERVHLQSEPDDRFQPTTA